MSSICRVFLREFLAGALRRPISVTPPQCVRAFPYIYVCPGTQLTFGWADWAEILHGGRVTQYLQTIFGGTWYLYSNSRFGRLSKKCLKKVAIFGTFWAHRAPIFEEPLQYGYLIFAFDEINTNQALEFGNFDHGIAQRLKTAILVHFGHILVSQGPNFHGTPSIWVWNWSCSWEEEESIVGISKFWSGKPSDSKTEILLKLCRFQCQDTGQAKPATFDVSIFLHYWIFFDPWFAPATICDTSQIYLLLLMR